MRLNIKTIKSIFRVKVLLILVAIILGIYITFVERNLVVTKKYEINSVENGENNLRVVQFSDTHLGEYYNLNNLEKAVNKINELNPDIVVFTGDLIDNALTYNDLFNISNVLSKINANSGKYAVYGNRDHGGGAENYYENIMIQSGFKVLKNSSTSIVVNGNKINIFGGDDSLLGEHNVKKTINGINKDDFNLLLIHEPDLIDQYKDYPIDLALSGHSHGGQVYIPFYGPIKKNILSEKYNRGMYYLDNEIKTKIYVNIGLGNTKVPFRFLTIPEIVVFDINI